MSIQKSKKREKKQKPGTKASQSVQESNSSSQEFTRKNSAEELVTKDDFLRINGIDFTIKQALNTLGIKTYSDFKGHNATALARALLERTEVDFPATRIIMEDWIGQAEKLAAEGKSENAKQQSEPDEIETQKEPETNVAPISEDLAKQEPTEQSENISKGTQKVRKQQRAKPARETTKLSEGAEYKTEAPEESQTKDSSASTSGTQIEPKTVSTKQNQSFGLEITSSEFVLAHNSSTGSTGSDHVEGKLQCSIFGKKITQAEYDQTPLSAQIFAIDLVSQDSQLICAKTILLQPGKRNYDIPVQFEVRVKAGRYQLQIFAFLQNEQPEIAFRRGPVLNVVDDSLQK